MAGGVAISRGGKNYPGKLTCNVLVTCVVAAMGGLIFGYDLGISGGVTSMPSFLKKFFPDVYRKEELHSDSTNQYCTFNSEKLTLFTSSLYLAALVASWVASVTTRKFGRKSSMVSGGVLFLLGAIVNALAQNLVMLYLGRVLLGAGIGFANQSVPVYLSEMAPYKYRGALNMGFQLFITIGILVANVINYAIEKQWPENGWRWCLGGAGVPGLIFTIGSFCLPDTPNSLIERGKKDEAKSRLQKIRGLEDVDEEFEDLITASDESKKIKHPWRNIFHRSNRPQLTFAVAIPAFQQLTGMNVITFYAPVLFRTIGFGNTAALMSALITGSINCVSTLVSIVTVDKIGRRKLFLQGGIQMLLCQLSIACAIGARFGVKGNPGALPKWYADLVVTLTLICVYVAGFAWSWGPLGWLIPSEIFPLEVRSAGQTINVSVNMFFTFVIAQIFTQMLCSFKFGLFLLFSFFVAIMTVFIYFFLPETKGVPIEEMGFAVWSKHWYWKTFVPSSPPTENANKKPTSTNEYELDNMVNSLDP